MEIKTTAAAAAVAPPAKTARARTVKATESTTEVTASRAAAIEGLSAIPVMACLATGQLADAGTITMYWPKMSMELAKLANDQPVIAAIADRVRIVGPYAGVLAVAAPMLLQLAVNHGRVPAGTGGTQSPDSIAAQLKAEIARAEVESLRAQMEAERESRELAAEYQKLANSDGA